MVRKNRQVTTLAVDIEVGEKIRELADNTGMSRLDLASQLLAECLSKFEVTPPQKAAVQLKVKTPLPPEDKPRRGKRRST